MIACWVEIGAVVGGFIAGALALWLGLVLWYRLEAEERER